MKEKTKKPHGTWGYRLYKMFVRGWHNQVLYRRIYYVDKHKIPKQGVSVILVSNHQNCANDPLVLLLGLENETHPYVIARGSVFGKNKLLDKFWQWLGMLPAFRLDMEGEDALAGNAETIRLSGGRLLEGNRLIMYPEGTHQDKRWLGEFKFGYTRLAFETAESDNFETEIFIQPTCNHYSSYFGAQQDVMIRFGDPISLKPYYELYKTKPRTAQRQVNQLVREAIESMMLDIRDLEHYDAIDFVRTESFGDEYATRVGQNPKLLPQKLIADKQLVAQFDKMEPADKDLLASYVQQYKDLLGSKLRDRQVVKSPSVILTVLALLAQVLLLPLWVVTLYPSVILYRVPQMFLRTDRMFMNTLILILPVVVLIPLVELVAVIGLWLAAGGLAALCWLVGIKGYCVICWYLTRWMEETFSDVRFLCSSSAKKADLIALRNQIKTFTDKWE